MSEDVERALVAGIALEERLDWEGALRHYESIADGLKLEPLHDAVWEGRRASAELRRGNALMVLRRMDDARAAFDAGLHAAKASRDPLVLARALMGAGVFAGSSGDTSRAERFLLEALDRFSRIDDEEGPQGAGWALLNLGALYGKTGRLDLGFVTLEKARERLHAISNWVGVASAWEAQSQIRRAIGDEDRWREDLAEAVIFYEKQGMTEKADQLRGLLKGKLI
jgi:tetratricopeptide (TPR) repeat protein